MTRAKLIRSLLLISLASVLAVGSTWAYLSTTTAARSNMFVIGVGLDQKVTLEEPKWPDLDEDNPPKVFPGAAIPKDPQIWSAATCDTDAYVAIMLVFKDSGGNVLNDQDYRTLMDPTTGLIKIQYGGSDTSPPPYKDATNGFNTNDWECISGANTGTQIWQYKVGSGTSKGVLTGGANLTTAAVNKTSPLFTRVFVNDGANQDAVLVALQQFGNFEIEVTGAAVQSGTGETDVADYAAAGTTLKGMLLATL